MSAVLPSPPPARPLPLRPGWFARLAKSLVSPAFLEFWGTHFNPAWSLHRPRARIVARRQESHDAVTLLLAPNRHWRGFQPGQHLSLGAEVDGSWTTRSYSLTDVPRADGRLAVTVRHVPDGRLSTHLCHHARVGEVVELGLAFGEMTLPALPAARRLFLAAGSGITPLMSMTRALAASAMPVPLTLLYWARHRDELCFVDELRGLARDLPGLQLPNVKDVSIADIWQRSNAFNTYRGDAWMKPTCRSCDERHKDFGGCRCQAFLLTGDPAETDPVCSKSAHHEKVVAVVKNAARNRHIPIVFRSDAESRALHPAPPA